MKALGQIEIETGLILNNPTLNVKNVLYDWINDTVKIEVLFNENESIINHSRTYEFDNSDKEELTKLDIYNFIKSNDVLKVFE